MENRFNIGDIVQHFKREYVKDNSAKYFYEILNFAKDTESENTLVVYQAMYEPFEVYARPLEMFCSEVDHNKYPDIKQKYRFEVIKKETERIDWVEAKKVLVKAFPLQNERAKKGQVVFTGSSLMENFPVEKWCAENSSYPVVYNRGVGGYKTADLMKILDVAIFDLEPSQIFINIGTNDLADSGLSLNDIMANYKSILLDIKQKLPDARVVMMAYYHGNYEAAAPELKDVLKIRTNEKINQANILVKNLAEELGNEFFDVNYLLDNEKGDLKAEYSLEGLHVNEAGYKAIFEEVIKKVMEK